MCWAAIGALGTWFAAIGTIAAVGYAIFHDYGKRPKLLVDFDHFRDIKLQENTVGLASPSTRSQWLRVRVVNAEGRRIASKCRGFLIKIQKGGSGEDIFPNDVRPLAWMHDPPDSAMGRDLLPGIVQWIDIAAAIQDERGLSVRVQPAWSIIEPGEYIFTVQISAEDARSVVIKVAVRWGGSLESLDGQKITESPLQ